VTLAGNGGGGDAEDRPVYVISVAARLAAMHPQTLRQYDRLGLVVPGRTRGRGRRYSRRDVEALREIQRLSAEEGINLAGIKRILELERQVRELQRLVDHQRGYLELGHRFFAVGPEGDAIPVRRGRRPSPRSPSPDPQGSRAVILWRPR
jgi:MerR family transcriptional regulator/heat shock protein HspR